MNQFDNVVVLFILVGAIPGTTYSIPPAIMFGANLGLLLLLLYTVIPFRRINKQFSKLVKSIIRRKQRQPEPRYSEL